MSDAIGLRVDVCTFQGMRKGVPRLLEALSRRGMRATFFFAMGPDCSGRAVSRLWRKKGFARKMLRTGAVRLYGFRTLCYGTLLPAPSIAARCAEAMRRVPGDGHEVGIHSWNHVLWQDSLDSLVDQDIRADYQRAGDAFSGAFGFAPSCSAAPAWLTNAPGLLAAEDMGFVFASDTRGTRPFRPALSEGVLRLPQVPTTLPTLDEHLGLEGTSSETFHARLLEELQRPGFKVHVVHAEVEGRAHAPSFERFLDRVVLSGKTVVPLGELLAGLPGPFAACRVERGYLPGRAGAVSIQGPAVGEESRL